MEHSLQQIGVDPVSRKYNIDAYYTGRPTILNSNLLKVAEVFMELNKITSPVKRKDIEFTLWERYGMKPLNVVLLLQTLKEQAFLIEEPTGHYRQRKWGEY